MTHNLSLILDIAAGLLVLGLLLTGAYETIAIVNLHISATPDIPTITSFVRPWVASHKMIALAIVAVVLASEFWLFFHFFLTA
jgi:hypothetical protein